MRADVVVSWSFATVPAAVKAKFQRPTKFIEIATPPSRAYFAQVNAFGWAAPIRGIINKYAPDLEPLRVAVLGFSESCHGVRNILGSGDGGRIDAAIAIDGVHTPYVQSGGKKVVSPADMAPWFEFAKRAILNERLFVDTYSSVKPPSYASTTETADWLWKTLNLDINPDQIVPPLPPLSAAPTTVKSNALPGVPSQIVDYPSIPWKLQRRAYGLVLLGLKNNQPSGVADHQYQAKVMLPLALEAFLVDRWNAIDPNDQQGSCYVAGAPPGIGALAGPCAKSVILPASYMSNKDSAFIVSGSTPGAGPNPVQPEPSPGGTSPPSSSTSIQQRDNTAFKIGLGVLGAGLLYYAVS